MSRGESCSSVKINLLVDFVGSFGKISGISLMETKWNVELLYLLCSRWSRLRFFKYSTIAISLHTNSLNKSDNEAINIVRERYQKQNSRDNFTVLPMNYVVQCARRTKAQSKIILSFALDLITINDQRSRSTISPLVCSPAAIRSHLSATQPDLCSCWPKSRRATSNRPV